MFNKMTCVLLAACAVLIYTLCNLYARCSTLEKQVTAYEETNKQLLDWYNTQQQINSRKETIDEALAEVADPEWNSDVLPDAYLRVLSEAGIYTNSAGSVAAGNTGSKDEGADKQ